LKQVKAHPDFIACHIHYGIYLDPVVAATLRVVAAERGTTVTAQVEEALLAWCRNTPEARRAKRRLALHH
jgi:predicted glycoside hydrolase/deacetylase ChbG (UPF0249 family)